MPNVLSPILAPLGLDPSQGYDTAAAGAKQAQQQANQLSDLQWQRQMQGLGQAQGYTNQLQSLYNSMYSPGGGQAAAGGMPAGGAMQAMGPQAGADMMMSHGGQQNPNPGPATGGGGVSSNQRALMSFLPGASTFNVPNDVKQGHYGQALIDLTPGAASIQTAANYGLGKLKSLF